jgi:hypothetical protein
MSSIEYFTNEFVSMMWDNTFTPDLYENNNIDKQKQKYMNYWLANQIKKENYSVF